jgi:hypothetical protein
MSSSGSLRTGAEPAHRKIAQLPAIGPEDVLDTGPDPYVY